MVAKQNWKCLNNPYKVAGYIEIGYAGRSAFIAVIKKTFGKTPGKYLPNRGLSILLHQSELKGVCKPIILPSVSVTSDTNPYRITIPQAA